MQFQLSSEAINRGHWHAVPVGHIVSLPLWLSRTVAELTQVAVNGHQSGDVLMAGLAGAMFNAGSLALLASFLAFARLNRLLPTGIAFLTSSGVNTFLLFDASLPPEASYAVTIVRMFSTRAPRKSAAGLALIGAILQVLYDERQLLS